MSGCLCHDRGPRYPADVTDAEGELLRPQAQAVMAELRRNPGGRPLDHDLRAARHADEWTDTRYLDEFSRTATVRSCSRAKFSRRQHDQRLEIIVDNSVEQAKSGEWTSSGTSRPGQQRL